DTNVHQMAINAWPFDELNAAYAGLHKRFLPFVDLPEGELTTKPLASLVLRILLVHEWRRVVLRDVDLPPDYKPDGWQGETVREMVSGLYVRLVDASEGFLDTLEAEPGVNLPRAAVSSRKRFRT
ncbi:MAG: PaaX family transcriptional regulator C-terminal domain-containing protein, partial [Pseudomonadota bacterium]